MCDIFTLLFNSGQLFFINLYRVYLFSNYILVACEGAFHRNIPLVKANFLGKFERGVQPRNNAAAHI